MLSWVRRVASIGEMEVTQDRGWGGIAEFGESTDRAQIGCVGWRAVFI